MKPITITAKSIEKIFPIFQKQTGDHFFYAMRQHKTIWPKLAKCKYEKDAKGIEKVTMESYYASATLRPKGKDIVVRLETSEPVIFGKKVFTFKLRKPHSDTAICSDLNGLARMVNVVSYATYSAMQLDKTLKQVGEDMKLFLKEYV